MTIRATGVSAAVRDLVDGMEREPWGRTSPSVYETGRLVTLAPWLAGHTDRVRWILSNQRPDGTWGPPDGYALVPTLSAVEALLSAGGRPAEAVDRGLHALSLLMSGLAAVPDTPAADLLVPAMIGQVNAHLERVGRPALPLPHGMDANRLAAVRWMLASGAAVPPKLLHAAESVADLIRGAPGVRPVPSGSIGASPAATAAWLDGPGDAMGRSAREYLAQVVRRHGAPVPCTVPITVFERSWVLSTLARVGVPLAAPPAMTRDLAAALGPDGTAAGPGLPADADTTAVVLSALALLGEPADPRCLLAYRVGPHFCTWPGENGVSVTTNAHVLDALGMHRAGSGSGSGSAVSGSALSGQLVTTVDDLALWLCDTQKSDGSWIDRWHASLYYPTSCCVLALDRFARTGRAAPAVGPAVDRAVRWVLATQRPDGSWGRWSGTAEETAYAMHVLLGVRRPPDRRVDRAVIRGRAYLREAFDEPGPALWHDKDLYRPAGIVRAFTIAALHLADMRAAGHGHRRTVDIV